MESSATAQPVENPAPRSHVDWGNTCRQCWKGRKKKKSLSITLKFCYLPRSSKVDFFTCKGNLSCCCWAQHRRVHPGKVISHSFLIKMDISVPLPPAAKKCLHSWHQQHGSPAWSC